MDEESPLWRHAMKDLGSSDLVPTIDWSILHNKLYARELECAQLRVALDDCCAEDEKFANQLVLLSGVSGTGKTRLAFSLRPIVTERSGLFISGKFDQLEVVESYNAIRQAFTDFVNQMLQRDVKERLLIKAVLKDITATDRVLLDVVPALGRLLDNRTLQKPHCKVTGAGVPERLILAFRELLRATCSPTCPVVLLLDDLQWSDVESLNLLSALVSDRNIRGLMVLGACRGNEVSIDDHLAVTLRDLESHDIHISHIILDCLDVKAVTAIVSDVFQRAPLESASLAAFVHRGTGGNAFFVVQLLRSLSDDGLIYYDRETREWTWNVDDTKMDVNVMESAVALLMEKIQRLPADVRDILALASCFGAYFEESTLSLLSSANVDAILSLAAEKGFVRNEPSRHGMWRFVHDQIQQSAYLCIEESVRPDFHLQIGKKLMRQQSEHQGDVFIAVNQLQKGAHLVQDEVEREELAMIFLKAGETASKTSAFVTAASYLNVGIQLLCVRHWRDQYNLSLDLFNAAAEVEYCNANWGQVEGLVSEILKHARKLGDRTRALTTMIYALGSRGELQQAADLGFRTLKELGETFPCNAGVLNVLFEYVKTKRILRRSSDEKILNLPLMRDPDRLAAVRIMNLMCTYTSHCRPTYAPLMAFRLVQVVLRDGMSGMASVGFSACAYMLCNGFSDIELGLRMGQLGLDVLDKFDAKEWLSRTYMPVYASVFCHRVNFLELLEPLIYAYRVGLGSGDMESACLNANCYLSMSFYASVPLPRLVEECKEVMEVLKTHKQELIVHFSRPLYQAMLNMLGQSNAPAVLDGGTMCVEELRQEATSTCNSTLLSIILIFDLLVASYLRRYDLAENAAAALAKCNTTSLPCYIVAIWRLHESLAAIYLRRRRSPRILAAALKKMKIFARYSKCNYNNKVFFLEAEIAASKGRLSAALEKYDASIACAREASLLNEMALAYERAAVVLKDAGRTRDSGEFLNKAIQAYQDWGAQAKVQQLLEEPLSS